MRGEAAGERECILPCPAVWMGVLDEPSPRGQNRMQVQTILNRVEKYKSFVYDEVKLVEQGAGLSLEVKIKPRANGQALCSGCGRPAAGYDRLRERRFVMDPDPHVVFATGCCRRLRT